MLDQRRSRYLETGRFGNGRFNPSSALPSAGSYALPLKTTKVPASERAATAQLTSQGSYRLMSSAVKNRESSSPQRSNLGTRPLAAHPLGDVDASTVPCRVCRANGSGWITQTAIACATRELEKEYDLFDGVSTRTTEVVLRSTRSRVAPGRIVPGSLILEKSSWENADTCLPEKRSKRTPSQ